MKTIIILFILLFIGSTGIFSRASGNDRAYSGQSTLSPSYGAKLSFSF